MSSPSSVDQRSAGDAGRSAVRGGTTTVAVVAAGLVVVAVTAVILLFGVRRVPALPAVVDPPALSPPGVIAYVGARDDEGACVHVVAAQGGPPRVLLCAEETPELEWISEIAWSPTGELLVRGQAEFGTDVVLVVDAATGRIVERRDLGGPERPVADPLIQPDALRRRDDGSELLLSADDGVARIAVRPPDGPPRIVLALDGPRDYAMTDAVWSPDGEWIAASDSEGRLLVLGDDGEPGPRLLVAHGPGRWTHPGALVWHIPGDDEGTVDPDELPDLG